jgi:cytochrome b subunit of formate dehydrogenase
MATPIRSLGQPWPRGFYRRRYVWQWPVRLSHWINVISVVALFLTGEYIAHPQLAPSGEPFQHFVMGLRGGATWSPTRAIISRSIAATCTWDTTRSQG